MGVLLELHLYTTSPEDVGECEHILRLATRETFSGIHKRQLVMGWNFRICVA